MVLPAATLTVCVAGVLMLQRMLGEVTSSTGELLMGWRTAAVDWVFPAMSVCQMSSFAADFIRVEMGICNGVRTVGRHAMGYGYHEEG